MSGWGYNGLDVTGKPASALPPKADLSRTLLVVRFVPIVLQKSKVATARFFREIWKRKEVDDLHSPNCATEVAHEFGARR